MQRLWPLGTLMGLVLGIVVARGQESLTIVQGGTAAITEQDPVVSSGYRMALSWEFMPPTDSNINKMSEVYDDKGPNERLAFGLSFGLAKLSGTRSSLGGKKNFNMSTVPICAVSRIMFGGKKLNVFVRIGLGAHYTTITFKTNPVETKTSGWGMAAITAGGIMYWLGKKTFLAGDYEWLWLGSTQPNLGSVGAFSLSAGLKL